MQIGEFARRARLSPKAFRLYDELGLLRPAGVDTTSGYRYYAPEQLERARLIARSRQLEVPLATIRELVDFDRVEPASAVAAYWQAVQSSHHLPRHRVDARGHWPGLRLRGALRLGA